MPAIETCLIVLELAPLTPRKIKRQQNHPEIHKLCNFLAPPPPHGEGDSNMAPVPAMLKL